MIEPIEGPSLRDAQLDIRFATGKLAPIIDRYASLKIGEQEVKKIKGKLEEAYPETFSEKLKAHGRYFPLLLPKPQTDQQIREQIVGDSAMRLEDEIKLIKAIGLKDGDRVLDLGAGFGRTSILMAEQANVHVVSMDKDEEKIKLFQSVLSNYRFNDGKLGSERITPIVGDATNLRQKIPSEEKVDVVVIKDIIGLLSKLDPNTDPNKKAVCTALAEKLEIFASKAREVLKEGGKVVIWDGDLTSIDLLETLETGMYLEGFKEKEQPSLIKFQVGQPPQDTQASFGIFFYEPNDEFLRIFRNVYSSRRIF